MAKKDIPSVMRPIMPDGTVKFSRIPIVNRFIFLFRYKGQCYIAHICGKEIQVLMNLCPDFVNELICPEGEIRRLSFSAERFSISQFELDKIIDEALAGMANEASR